jgi:NAD(P)H-hydrate repair Nnr-like enzyme with NAD(P)H-hydrate dehydratase domain
LTPHAGELARLLGTDAASVNAHRLDAVRRAATRFGSVVLLKGSDTLVARPRGGVLVSLYGEPSLAAAGTGDVLTGVVAAFLAKGLEPQAAAGLAAVAHGVASKLVPHQAGLVASDLLPGIQRAIAGDGWQFPSA